MGVDGLRELTQDPEGVLARRASSASACTDQDSGCRRFKRKDAGGGWSTRFLQMGSSKIPSTARSLDQNPKRFLRFES